MTTESNRAAGVQITRFLMQNYQTARGIHCETIIGAAAALAGEFALRASEPTLPDSRWVTSTKSTGLLFENEARGEMSMWTIIRVGAEKAGAAPKALPDPVEVTGRVAASLGQSPFPPLSVPEEHAPHEWSPNACPLLRDAVERIGRENGLSPQDLALELAMCITFLIHQAKDVLPPAIAATLALEIMIGVSRMVPMQEPIRDVG
jgi:hypothetical protein